MSYKIILVTNEDEGLVVKLVCVFNADAFFIVFLIHYVSLGSLFSANFASFSTSMLAYPNSVTTLPSMRYIP